MKTAPAVKIFIWKAAQSILPNNMRVAAILPEINTNCKFCNERQEALTHLFLYCSYVKQVWMHFNFDMQFIKDGTNNFHDWLSNCFQNANRGGYGIDWQVLCSTIIWHIWKARCDITFKKKRRDSEVTDNNIIKFINSYETVHKSDYDIMHILYYNPLNDETLKITTDQIPKQT